MAPVFQSNSLATVACAAFVLLAAAVHSRPTETEHPSLNRRSYLRLIRANSKTEVPGFQSNIGSFNSLPTSDSPNDESKNIGRTNNLTESQLAFLRSTITRREETTASKPSGFEVSGTVVSSKSFTPKKATATISENRGKTAEQASPLAADAVQEVVRPLEHMADRSVQQHAINLNFLKYLRNI